MPDLNLSWAWISLALLGAFHGLNPAMGWLFAVAIGFQERRLRAVLTALGPITLGHALSLGLVAVPVGLLGLVIPRDLLLTLTGLILLGFAGHKFATRFRHPRWVGMRLRPRELVLWSFLMATAHGAGLMLAPVLVRLRGEAVPSALAEAGHAEHLAHVGHAGHQGVRRRRGARLGRGRRGAALGRDAGGGGVDRRGGLSTAGGRCAAPGLDQPRFCLVRRLPARRRDHARPRALASRGLVRFFNALALDADRMPLPGAGGQQLVDGHDDVAVLDLRPRRF